MGHDHRQSDVKPAASRHKHPLLGLDRYRIGLRFLECVHHNHLCMPC